MPLNSEKCCAEPLHSFTSGCVSPKRSNVIAGEPHLGKGLVALRNAIQNFAAVSVESGAHTINVLTKCFPSSHLGTKRSPKDKIWRQQFSRRVGIARIPDSFVKFSYEFERTSQVYFRHCRHSIRAALYSVPPVPEAGTLQGVSSACSFPAASTCRTNAFTRGLVKLYAPRAHCVKSILAECSDCASAISHAIALCIQSVNIVAAGG
jgi:hypothetical protein